jgi:hypothetical protein
MFLKSEGFASDLYDADRAFTLKRFCRENGLHYGDSDVPVPLSTMVAYGLAFQQRFVPDVDYRTVVALTRTPEGFQLRLSDGDAVQAGRIVVAVGHSHFRYVPPTLSHLPPEHLSHSSDHHDLTRFAGQDVTVIGGGASALDLAALLHRVGAGVQLVARRTSLAFLPGPGSRSLWHQLRYPKSGIGGGWRSRFFTDAPMLFRCFPRELRTRIVRTYLGPAGGWWTKDVLLQHVPLLLGHLPRRAEVRNGAVHLQVQGSGGPRDLVAGHVIAATGYRVDLRRLPFLSEGIRHHLKCLEGAPVVSRDFESSVAGLYFVGLATAQDFGPVMRFMFGAGYTARRLSAHLSRAFALSNATAPESEGEREPIKVAPAATD